MNLRSLRRKPKIVMVLTSLIIMGISWYAYFYEVPNLAPRALPAGQIVSTQPANYGIMTSVRPNVTHLTPNDPIWIAVHWSTQTGPLPETPPFYYLSFPSIHDFEFTVTTPKMKTIVVQAKRLVTNDDAEPSLQNYFPTMFLCLSSDGLSSGRQEAPWKEKQNLSFEDIGMARAIKNVPLRLTEFE